MYLVMAHTPGISQGQDVWELTGHDSRGMSIEPEILIYDRPFIQYVHDSVQLHVS